MNPRMDIATSHPHAYRGMLALEKYLVSSPLPQRLKLLVELRVSQMNGCAYCVDRHSHALETDGETAERLFAVVTWWEAPFFTPAERAALALAEQATRLEAGGVSDETWAEAEAHYGPDELAALVTTIATINAWNRFGVVQRLVPGSHRAAATAAAGE